MKIFISHSSKDQEYGKVIVQLLIDIGVSHRDIIFTSKPGYGIPKGKNIFNWLKSQIKEKPFVIYLLSENYYSSIACLNEMGAAWVVESEHIPLFVPTFDLNKSDFLEGAIDPRNLGVFINEEEGIIEFAEMIKSEIDSNINLVIFNQAINKYMKMIKEIEYNREKESPQKKVNIDSATLKEESFDQALHSENELKNKNNSYSVTKYDSFIANIQDGKLADEELLLLKYLIDTGSDILGDRWMAEEEIENIRHWQDVNELDNYLANNYTKALNKIKMRKFVDVYSTTSHGNPREYKLIDDIAIQFLNLPEEVVIILTKTIKKHKILMDEELPF